jgi:hypothetical protein
MSSWMLPMRLETIHRALIAGMAMLLVACGSKPPPPARGVIETDLGSWQFRRYQALHDVEVWVPDNQALAHTASYVRGEAAKTGRLALSDVVNVFVTRYQREPGILRALIKFARRLAQESGYVVEERKQGGVRLIAITGPDEKWVLWPARGHVVKIGGRELDAVPTALIKAYGERYPSRLDSGMLDGPLPEEPTPDERAPARSPYDPDHPTPDWDGSRRTPGEIEMPGGQKPKE